MAAVRHFTHQGADLRGRSGRESGGCAWLWLSHHRRKADKLHLKPVACAAWLARAGMARSSVAAVGGAQSGWVRLCLGGGRPSSLR
jgi:hypothetical protein